MADKPLSAADTPGSPLPSVLSDHHPAGPHSLAPHPRASYSNYVRCLCVYRRLQNLISRRMPSCDRKAHARASHQFLTSFILPRLQLRSSGENERPLRDAGCSAVVLRLFRFSLATTWSPSTLAADHNPEGFRHRRTVKRKNAAPTDLRCWIGFV